MSIVGTRPPLISETNLYEPRHKALFSQMTKGKETGSIYREDPRKGVEQIFGNNPAVSGGETPPENDAAGNSRYYRDKIIEYGTV